MPQQTFIVSAIGNLPMVSYVFVFLNVNDTLLCTIHYLNVMNRMNLCATLQLPQSLNPSGYFKQKHAEYSYEFRLLINISCSVIYYYEVEKYSEIC